jgi:hypothetical protein
MWRKVSAVWQWLLLITLTHATAPPHAHTRARAVAAGIESARAALVKLQKVTPSHTDSQRALAWHVMQPCDVAAAPQVCGATAAATVSATLRVSDLLCMDDELERALQLLLQLHAQVPGRGPAFCLC